MLGLTVDKVMWTEEVCFLCEGVFTVSDSQTFTWGNPHFIFIVDINMNSGFRVVSSGIFSLGIHLIPEGQFLHGFSAIWKPFCWRCLNICLEL